MSSPTKETEDPSSSNAESKESTGANNDANTEPRPPAKRPMPTAVIEISDTESDDSDVCAVNSYQATADEVKRIRKDYSSSSSSSSSSNYSSDSDSPWEDDSYIIEDRVYGKPVKGKLFVRANRMDDPKFNPNLKSEDIISKIKSHWNDERDHSSELVSLTCKPYRLCRLHGLLENPEFINNIIDDMNTLDWSRKKMDLYEFHQTSDLANLTWQRSIRGIYELLKTEVMSWVSEVTGLELTSVSASCSLYGPGDHLLVHDDRLGDRRVAFILYLVPWTPRPPKNIHNGREADKKFWPGWRPRMGGALELIEDGEVACRTYPSNNTLSFFAVGPKSFHQVSEILSLELPRLSINGWFHGPTPEPEESHSELPESLSPHNQVVVLKWWVNPGYLCPRARAQVQRQMERASEVCLEDLLLPSRCQQLLDALEKNDIEWEQCGPLQQRRYQRVTEKWLAAGDAPAAPEAASHEGEAAEGGAPEAGVPEVSVPEVGAPEVGAPEVGAPEGSAPEGGPPEGSAPEGGPPEGGPPGGGVNEDCGVQGEKHVVRALMKLLSSTAFMRLVSDCTDLPLTVYRKLELQRWRAGDYTLLPPREQYQQPRLEAVLYLGAPDHPISGGQTLYVAPEEGSHASAEALVTLPPKHNALGLVYCDAGAASFTKYISRMTMQEGFYFYIVTCTYAE